MIELGLLGTARVRSRSTDTESLLARRKPLGLLVYLAVAPGVFHSRNVLCGLLWPDTDDGRARRSLRVALHHLREHLGSDAVLSRDDGAVGVDPERVTSDVARLLSAIELGNAAEVARLYRGPFLSGFHTGAGPFDRWIDEERVSLERLCTDAIQHGAEEALARGEHRHAAALAADLLRIRPTDLRAIETRVEALGALGAVARALEDLERFRDYFEEELELPAPTRVDELERTIRAAARETDDAGPPPPVPEAPRPVPASAPAPAPAPASPAPAATAGMNGPAPPGSASPLPSRPRRFRLPGAAGMTVLIGLAGALAILVIRPGGGAPVPPTEPAPIHVPPAEAAELLEEGRRLRNAGLFSEAVEVYRRAVAVDSLWGEAHYELALVARWAGWPDISGRHLRRATELADGMSTIERTLTRAMSLDSERDVLGAYELYLTILDEAPDDVRANMELAELEFHWGPTIGIPPEDARPRFERVAELATSPEAERHLARLDARAGDTAALRVRLRRVEAMEAPEELVEEVRVLDAVIRSGRPTGGNPSLGTLQSVAASRAPRGRKEAFFEEVVRRSTAPRNRLLATILRAQVALEGGRLAEAQEWVERIADVSAARRDEFTAVALTLPFRPPAPESWARMADRLEARSGDVLISPLEGDLAAPAIYAPRRIFLQGLLRGAGRITPDTAAFARLTQQSWVDTAYINNHVRILRARSLMEAGAPAEDVLEALGPPGLRPGGLYPTVLAYPTAYKRFLRARVLGSLGRIDEALRWYRTFPDIRGYDIAFLPGVLLTRGRLEVQLGRLEDARDTFDHLVELLADADPEYQALLTEARMELSRLGPGPVP